MTCAVRGIVCALMLVLAAASVSPRAFAATRATQFALQNGMQVVVIPDHRAPIVTNMVWYRVGGSDDPMGLSGAAHFFEHLMFKGTKTTPSGEFSRIVARNGGEDNAFTTHDFTAFFQRIAKDRLAIVMKLEADRMMNLDLSDENVNTEREVVLEERHTRVDSDPEARFQEQLEAGLYLSHPYGRPVIGWPEEIRHIGRTEAIDFYTHHYAPNNATLIVAGDVEPDEVHKLADQIFGSVPGRGIAQRMDIPQPPRLAETRIAMTDRDTKLPVLMRIYRVPSYAEATPGVAESMEVLAQLMGGGPTSRLYRTLVMDKKVAASVSATYDGMDRDAGEYTITVNPREGVSLDTLERELDAVIVAMAGASPDSVEFNRAKTQLIASATYKRDNLTDMATDYGTALSIGLTIDDVEEWPDRIKQVVPGDVRKAAQTYLRKSQAVTGRLTPPATPAAPAPARAPAP